MTDPVCQVPTIGPQDPSYSKTLFYYLNEMILNLWSSDQGNFACIRVNLENMMNDLNNALPSDAFKNVDKKPNTVKAKAASPGLIAEMKIWPQYTKNQFYAFAYEIVPQLQSAGYKMEELLPVFFPLFILLLNLESTQIIAANPIVMGFTGLEKVIEAMVASTPPTAAETASLKYEWQLAAMTVISAMAGDVDYKNWTYPSCSASANDTHSKGSCDTDPTKDGKK